MVGPDKKERTFPKLEDYVPWARKLEVFKRMKGYNPPENWINGEPDELTWSLLKRYPVAVPSIGNEDSANPRGSGYYGVVRLDLAEHALLYRSLQVRTVIPCKEQLLNRYTNNDVEAWPLDTLTIVPDAPESHAMPSIPEGVARRNGLWLDVEDELAETSGYVEDYGEPSSMAAEDFVADSTEANLADMAWREYGVTGFGNEDMDYARSHEYNPSSGDVL